MESYNARQVPGTHPQQVSELGRGAVPGDRERDRDALPGDRDAVPGTRMLCPGTSHLFKHQHSKGGFCKQRGIPGLSQPCSLALPQPQDEPSVTGVGQQSRLLSQASGCLENLCKELRPARPRKCVIPRAELLPAVSGGRRIVLKPQ